MLRRSVASLVVLVLVAGFVSAATLDGTIKKVDGEKSTLVVTGKDNKDVTVTVIKDAKITLDGKAAKLADLKEGMTVKVTHEDNKATEVDAKAAKDK
jgi:biopolymer transport protein ExbD